MPDDTRKARSTDIESQISTPSSGRVTDSLQRRMRKVHPLGLRVVVRICKEGDMTDSGLYLPEGAKEATQESILAEVVEVASALDTHTDEETNVSGVPLGAKVLIPKSTGTKVPWDDELRVVDTREILAIVDEISLS